MSKQQISYKYTDTKHRYKRAKLKKTRDKILSELIGWASR